MNVIRLAQLCEMLNVSESTVRSWIATGRIPPPRRPTQRTMFWLQSDLQAWLTGLPTGPIGVLGSAAAPGPAGMSEL